MLVAEAVLKIDIHQQVVKCLTLVLGPCCNFADQTDGCWCILVTNLIVGKESETFFTATNIFLFSFAECNFTRNPFEACVAVTQFHIILFCHLGNDFSRYDGLNQEIAAL